MIIIDVQRDFTLSGGSAEIPGTIQDIPYIQDLTQGCKKLGYPVINAVRLCGRLQQIGSMEWIMYKSRWGAFYSTLLEEHLCSLAINTVIIAGCNFPNCPRSTIHQASERDFRIILAKDATSQT